MAILGTKYAIVQDSADDRDVELEFVDDAAHYPPTGDLRTSGFLSPVVDQGQLGSCTANAIGSGLREFMQLKSGQSLIRLSRLFLYWNERYIEGTINEDAGAEIRDGMRILQKIGICKEEDFPYDVSTFENKPSDQAFLDAATFKITEYHRVKNLNALKSVITSGFPVVAGIQIFDSFESEEVAQSGLVPMPLPNENNLGGHAVLIVGYDDVRQLLILRNSWGESWGDQGYFYLPYAYLTQGYVMDMWCGK